MMSTSDDGLLDKQVEWPTQVQHPIFLTDEYYNGLVKAWAPERWNQWGRHDEFLCMEGDAIQTSRHYEGSSINEKAFVQDYPMQHQLYPGIPNSNPNHIESFGGFVSTDAFANEGFPTNPRHDYNLPGDFSDNNRPVGSGYEENPSMSTATIASIKNGSERPAQQNKRSVGNETNEISSTRGKRARKSFPTAAKTFLDVKTTHDKSKESLARIFKELFENKHHAEEFLETVMELHRKPESDCSFPADDTSFPRTDEEYRQRVRQVFDAICDWSYILEWRTVLPKGQESRIIAEILDGRPAHHDDKPRNRSLADFMPTKAELASVLPPVEDQQRRVLRQIPNNQTIEWISWGIVGAAIKSQQGNTQVPYWCVSEGG